MDSYTWTYKSLLCVNTGCRLEDLTGVMDDRDGYRESLGTPYYQHNYIYMICIAYEMF